MAKKGQKFKHWTAEEKYKVIEPALKLEKSRLIKTKELNSSFYFLLKKERIYGKRKDKKRN